MAAAQHRANGAQVALPQNQVSERAGHVGRAGTQHPQRLLGSDGEPKRLLDLIAETEERFVAVSA